MVHDAHLAIGHDGRNRMVKETQAKYKNITAESIMLYLSLCVPCLKKSKVPKKGLVIKPMIFSEMNSRAQVDLTDMQSQPNGGLKWIPNKICKTSPSNVKTCTRNRIPIA